MDISNYKYMDSLFLSNYKKMDKIDVCANSERELTVKKIEKGMVLPYKEINGEKKAGVVDQEGNFVEISGFTALSPVDAWGGAYKTEQRVPKVESEVIYFGRFWKH